MVDRHEVLGEIEVVAEGENQQRLTEREEGEIQSEAQREFCARWQADLDALRALLQQPAPRLYRKRPTNSNYLK
jgi:hypothetical protein